MVTYADKPWLKHYDEGVPYSLGGTPERTVHSYLQETAKRRPRRAALVTSVRLPMLGHQKHVITYGELDRLSDAFACALVDWGLQKGQTVCLLMPNISAFVIAYYGILKAGGVVAAVNPAYPPSKIQYQVNDCDAVMVITITALYQTFKDVQSGTKVRAVVATNIKEYLAPLARAAFTATQEKKGGHALDALQEGDLWFQDMLKRFRGKKPDVEVLPDDIAFLQYTGGTTGLPKGAMATHRMLAFSTEQVAAWTDVQYAQVYKDRTDRSKFTSLVALPMFHVFGLVIVLNQSIVCGWEIVLVPDARDTNTLVDILDVYKPEVLCAVPLLWYSLVNHPRFKSGEMNFSWVRIGISAASPLHQTVWQSVLDAGMRNLVDAYGMSEVPIGNHANTILKPAKMNSIGVPMPDVEVRVVDLETGTRVLPVGETGEIILHTPNVMLGYYNKPEESAEVLRYLEGKRWMYTGDVGYMDEEGYFYLVDRKKDMAIIGGFNVYPAVIERVLKTHPAIADAGVWRVPHPKVVGEEAVQGWIVLKEGESVKTADLVNYCKPYLAAYEIPRKYVIVDKLPYSEAGKLLRRELPKLKASRKSTNAEE